MSLFQTLGRLFRIGEAAANEAVEDLEAKKSIALGKLTLRDARKQLREHQLALGTYDGLRITLEQDVDSKTDELGTLKSELEEFVTIIELGGEGEADARQAAASTLGEIEDLEADLKDLNLRLDEVNAGYEEMFEEVQGIEDYLEEQSDAVSYTHLTLPTKRIV